MNAYLQNLIPRLQQFSLSLDRKEVFIDYPWVRIDEKGNKETYIFKRNGELIMSLNGSAAVGKWELLIIAGALMIDRVKDKILLKHDFIDKALMILKTDDFKSIPFILINSNIIPDLDIEKYLQTNYLSNNTPKKPLQESNDYSQNVDSNSPMFDSYLVALVLFSIIAAALVYAVFIM